MQRAPECSADARPLPNYRTNVDPCTQDDCVMIRKLFAILAALVIALAIALTALLNWPLPDMPRPGVAGDFLIRNVAVVDVVNGRTVPGRDVVVRAGRIHSIEAGNPGRAERGLRVVDGSGRFLMPGLWDMHVHSLKISPQFNHPLLIAAGVTGVREMWGCPTPHDRFLACGEDIERWRMGLRTHRHLAPRYVQRASYRMDGDQGVPAAAPAFFKTRTPDEVRALVAHQATARVDVVKTYTNLSRAAYEALAAEAPKRGLRVAGHLPVRVPLETALAAGQNSIEHPRVFLLECHRDIEAFRRQPDPMAAFTTAIQARVIDERDPERCARLMSAMAASDTWWTPTLQVLRKSALARDAAFREDARKRYIPLLILKAIWEPDADGDADAAARFPERDVHGQLYQLALDDVRQAHAAGVKMLAGTDAPDTYVYPGFSIHDELAEFVRAGLSPADALRSATLNPARFSGQARDYGSIEVGKVADMVLLDADPLTDIRNTGRIRGLFFNGQHLDRVALDELLAFAESQARSVRANVQLLWSAVNSPVIQANFDD